MKTKLLFVIVSCSFLVTLYSTVAEAKSKKQTCKLYKKQKPKNLTWSPQAELCIENIMTQEGRLFKNLSDYNHARAFAACQYFNFTVASAECESVVLNLPQSVAVPIDLQANGHKASNPEKQLSICSYQDDKRGAAACKLQLSCAPPYNDNQKLNCAKSLAELQSVFGKKLTDQLLKVRHLSDLK